MANNQRRYCDLFKTSKYFCRTFRTKNDCTHYFHILNKPYDQIHLLQSTVFVSIWGNLKRQLIYGKKRRQMVGHVQVPRTNQSLTYHSNSGMSQRVVRCKREGTHTVNTSALIIDLHRILQSDRVCSRARVCAGMCVIVLCFAITSWFICNWKID